VFQTLRCPTRSRLLATFFLADRTNGRAILTVVTDGNNSPLVQVRTKLLIYWWNIIHRFFVYYLLLAVGRISLPVDSIGCLTQAIY